MPFHQIYDGWYRIDAASLKVNNFFDNHSGTLQGSFLLNEQPYANLVPLLSPFPTILHVMTNAKTKTRATIMRGINCIRLGRLTINHSCKVRLPLMWVTQNRKAVSLICMKYAALRFSATEKGATHRYQLSLERTIKIDTFSFFVNLLTLLTYQILMSLQSVCPVI